MPDFAYVKNAEGGPRFAITVLLTLGTLLLLFGPGSKSAVVFFLMITIINMLLSIIVLLRHLNNTLKEPWLNLPWKKAETFIYLGGAGLQTYGVILCFINGDSGVMKFAAGCTFVAVILMIMIGLRLKKDKSEFLKRYEEQLAEKEKEKEAETDENGVKKDKIDKTQTLESHLSLDVNELKDRSKNTSLRT